MGGWTIASIAFAAMAVGLGPIRRRPEIDDRPHADTVFLCTALGLAWVGATLIAIFHDGARVSWLLLAAGPVLSWPLCYGAPLARDLIGLMLKAEVPAKVAAPLAQDQGPAQAVDARG